MAMSEQTIMPDALKPIWLLGAERHQLACSVLAIILPLKADAAVLEADQSAIGDRHPMGVTAEISEHLLRAAERTLGVHNPIRSAQRHQTLLEGSRLCQRRQFTEELQPAGFEGGGDLLEQELLE